MTDIKETDRKMRVLSFDCANKTIGVCMVEVPGYSTIKSLISDCFDSKELNTWDQILIALRALDGLFYRIFDLKYINSFDLIPGQKLKISSKNERSSRLKGLLKYIDAIMGDVDNVLIEYQMNANDKSRSVCNMIEAHYSGESYKFKQNSSYFSKLYPINIPENYTNKVVIVNPRYKNMFAFNKNLIYSIYLAKYNNNKTANKKHCTDNMLYFLNRTGKMGMIEGMKKMDDAADALMQCIVWILTLNFNQYKK